MTLYQQVNLLSTNWKNLLIQYPKWNEIEYLYKQESGNIYPHIEYIFRCFDFFNVEDTKVVILGQDPYHGHGQANGLAFAVNNNINHPPSLKNIFKLIPNKTTDSTLISWANQGILLLNTYLTVKEKSPCSHKHIWKDFTTWILKQINEFKCKPFIIIWGGHAYNIVANCGLLNEKCFISSHPSPLSFYKQYKDYPSFESSNVFEKVNNHLQTKIVW